MNKNVAAMLLIITAICFPLIVAKTILSERRHRITPHFYYQAPIQQAVPIDAPISLPIISAPKTKIIGNVPQTKQFAPKIMQGGRNLESGAYNYAARNTTGGPLTKGVLLHEGTHVLNSQLNQSIGGADLLRPSRGFCAFYFWGEDQYLIMPTAGFAKNSVINNIPMECISKGTLNVYFGSMFANRDALHIIEDFVSELNGFEANSPTLLRDMAIYSIALGYMLQSNEEYQAGNMYLLERACRKPIDLSIFRASTSQKAVALKNYLRTTYGQDWVARNFGF